MASRNYRVGEIEVKANNTSVIKGYNFDSRYYLNDKDAPAEDTFDYSGLADPSEFVQPCVLRPDWAFIYDSSDIYGNTWKCMSPIDAAWNAAAYPFISTPNNSTTIYHRWLLVGHSSPFTYVDFNVERVDLAGARAAGYGCYGTGAYSRNRVTVYNVAGTYKQIVGFNEFNVSQGNFAINSTELAYTYGGQNRWLSPMQAGRMSWALPAGWAAGWYPQAFQNYVNYSYYNIGMPANFGPTAQGGSNLSELRLIPYTSGSPSTPWTSLPGKGGRGDSYFDYYWALIMLIDGGISGNAAKLRFFSCPTIG